MFQASARADRVTPVPLDRPFLEAEDAELLQGLRRGDERAFLALVERHHAAMLRIAACHLSASSAEAVVRETWVAALAGLGRFDGGSSLSAWIFSLLVERLPGWEHCERGPTVDPGRFLGAGHPQWPGHWASAPSRWGEHADGDEVRELARRAVPALPASQQRVIVLRDIEGWPAADVCSALELSDAEQRALLHRARAHVRRSLAGSLGEDA